MNLALIQALVVPKGRNIVIVEVSKALRKHLRQDSFFEIIYWRQIG